MDDEIVKKMKNKTQVISEEAYILFYKYNNANDLNPFDPPASDLKSSR